MFEGHPLIVTAQLEASQVELTVLHKRNGAFFDLTRLHFCVTNEHLREIPRLARLSSGLAGAALGDAHRAIGLWPISERAAARLTNGQMKEADLTGEMMRPFREAPTRYWYVSGRFGNLSEKQSAGTRLGKALSLFNKRILEDV
jgi:hypothetical protein